MKDLALIILVFVFLILGCSGGAAVKEADWTKARKIAGKEQKLSHISGMVVDDKFAYVTMGGTIADQNEGTSGVRKVALENGAVTVIDDGSKNIPQSDYGGMAMDDKFVYWNNGGRIARVAKDGGNIDTLADENVGIGIDIAVDGDKVYWSNHGYYSPGQPNVPKPIYCIAKKGGNAEVFADQQMVPRNIVLDDKYVYWITQGGILKKLKAGGQEEPVRKVDDSEGLDELSQDADSLYYGFRSKGNSRWSLQKVAKTGGEPITLVKAYSLKPVVVDDKDVYFFDEETLNKDALCRVPKNGGAVSRFDTGYESGVIEQSRSQVYFAGMDDIFSFAK